MAATEVTESKDWRWLRRESKWARALRSLGFWVRVLVRHRKWDMKLNLLFMFCGYDCEVLAIGWWLWGDCDCGLEMEEKKTAKEGRKIRRR